MVGGDDNPPDPAIVVSRLSWLVFLTIFALAMLAPGFALFVTDELFDEDSGAAALFVGGVSAGAAAIEFVAQPVLGAVADAAGRKPVIRVSLAVQALTFALMGALPSKAVLATAMLLRAGFSNTYTTAVAMCADVCTAASGEHKLTVALGRLAAVSGLAGVLGVATGTVLAERSPALPFLAGALVHAINYVYVWRLVPETLPSPPTAFSLRDSLRPNPLPALRVLWASREAAQLAAIFFATSLASKGVGHVFLFWTQYRFDWGTKSVAVFLGYFGVLVSLSMLGVKWVLRWLGERRVLVLGYGVLAACFALVGLAFRGYQVYALMLFGSLGFAATPALHGLLTKGFPPDAQGASQGALSALAVCAGGLGPLLFTGVYDVFKGEYDNGSAEAQRDVGAAVPFFLGSLLFVFSAVVARAVQRTWAADGGGERAGLAANMAGGSIGDDSL